MAGVLKTKRDRRDSKMPAILPTEAAESAFASALEGCRFDDRGPASDRAALRRINTVDQTDNFET